MISAEERLFLLKKLEKQEVFLLSMDPDPRSFLSYLFVAGLVLLAGFFSGSETAYASCSRVRLMAWADDGKKSASRALSILEQFDKALITLLIGNNVIHVIATSTAAVMAIRLAGPAWGPVFSTVIMTLLVFIFSETIPKNIAKANSDHFACAVSLPLRILIAVLTPLDLLCMGLGKLLRLVFRSDPAETAMTEDDFHSMIETIEDEVLDMLELLLPVAVPGGGAMVRAVGERVVRHLSERAVVEGEVPERAFRASDEARKL